MLGYGHNPYKELEKALGYGYRRRSRLEEALTHRSFRFEQTDINMDNQRLEFLGDAILGLVIAEHLYKTFGDKDEGFLTALRSQTTSGKVLADVASSLQLGKFLRIGRGEEQSGGRKRPSNLADALEAVIAAAYFDGGTKAVNRIFKKVFEPLIEGLSGDVWADNPKGHLQEYSQRKWKAGPRYRVVNRHGPPHAAIFVVEATLADGTSATGKGPSKRDAEIGAAVRLLAKVGVHQAPGACSQH